MSMTLYARHLGYATREKMTRILRHRAVGVKHDDDDDDDRFHSGWILAAAAAAAASF